MKRLLRPHVRLPTLTSPSGAGVRQRNEHVKTRTQDPAAILKFPDHWNNVDVRGALLAMHGWVCAYCDRPLGLDRRPDIDHFRPKSAAPGDAHSGYWWLAYEFENYLLSCSTCNSLRKGSKFPLDAGAAHVDYDSRSLLPQEARLLMDPASDPVEDWLRMDYHAEKDLWRVVVSADADRAQRMAQTTCSFFRLNDWRLLQQRAQAVDTAQAAYLRWLETRSSDDLDALRRRASRLQSHGMAVRAWLALGAPEIELPSRDDELFWLLEDVDCQLYTEVQAGEAGEQVQSSTEELLWMLAVLWKHPPAMSTDEIEFWLKDKGWKPRVEPLYRQL